MTKAKGEGTSETMLYDARNIVTEIVAGEAGGTYYLDVIWMRTTLRGGLIKCYTNVNIYLYLLLFAERYGKVR